MPKHSRNERNKKKRKNMKSTKKVRPNVKRKTINKEEDENRKPKALSHESNANSNTNKKKKGKQKFSQKHPKLMLAIKILIILFLLMCVVGAGIIAGVFFGLFGDEFEITKEELKIAESNSIIVDKNGAVIANLSGTEKRKIIKLEDMADYLPKAYVAIEDERFYKHNGVDLKRTAGAILNTVLNGSSSYGGSTITQQLVKNITKEDDSSGIAGIMRKVKEWAKAYQVERMISKEQILELYLNILYVGGEGNLHGVELGAEYYFNKSAKDLSLAECAYMAGINSSPNAYNPFNEEKDNTEKIKNKTKTVLNKMKELGFIENEEDYNNAIAEVDAGLKFEKGTMSTGTVYSYHTDAVVEQVINQVMEEKGISRQLAENYVYGGGLTIYSTVDNTIQTRLEEEYKKEKYIKTGHDKNSDGTLINEHTQSGMAIVDYKTGYVVAIAGGLGEKTGAGWNRATQMTRQTGSSIKPLADVIPGLEEKIITAATMYDDVKTDFGNNYKPKNDGEKYRGNINIREFIKTSQNIPAVKIMKELTPKKSLEYLAKLGITSLDEKEDDVIALAIGGMTNGVSPLEMAVAYGTIANNGIYITPTFYTKVEDSNGNAVLTVKQEQVRAVSEQNAYITKTILQEPVKSGGTATYCAISGMDVAAKTGTTDKNYDRWLCGFTPYYAAATWFGYDNNEEVRYKDFTQNPAGQIWDAVMTDIHKNLAKATFEKPASGIVKATVCRTTGCLATTGCVSTYEEIFTQDNMPGKCEGHGTQEICSASGKMANEYCPKNQVKKVNYGGVLPKETLELWKPINGYSSTKNKVTEICDIHKKPEEPEKKPDDKPKNNTTGNNTTGNNTSGNNTSGNNTSGNNTTENNTPNENTTGNNTSNGGNGRKKDD